MVILPLNHFRQQITQKENSILEKECEYIQNMLYKNVGAF